MLYYRKILLCAIAFLPLVLQSCEFIDQLKTEVPAKVVLTIANPDNLPVGSIALTWGIGGVAEPLGTKTLTSPAFPYTYTIKSAKAVPEFLISAVVTVSGEETLLSTSINTSAGGTFRPRLTIEAPGELTATVKLTIANPDNLPVASINLLWGPAGPTAEGSATVADATFPYHRTIAATKAAGYLVAAMVHPVAGADQTLSEVIDTSGGGTVNVTLTIAAPSQGGTDANIHLTVNNPNNLTVPALLISWGDSTQAEGDGLNFIPGPVFPLQQTIENVRKSPTLMVFAGDGASIGGVRILDTSAGGDFEVVINLSVQGSPPSGISLLRDGQPSIGRRVDLGP